ncbi:Pantothenate synthetase [Geodia barretti]|uniref:Pantoate--beta-alanine ligase n=1 Tax=Geodia barretti TaxID=519541 RepID=A0AA35SK20_GEOBA|nr:Pantothenate synthetase [Geodia barretti]
MRVIHTNQDMKDVCRSVERPVGLVPTMGALHEGHLALVRLAKQENRTLAATIFVNPAQFGPGEDLQKYPRDLEKDLDLLRNEGADLVYVPDVEEVYPPGFDSWVEVGGLGDKLEGAHRPGHFRGVATVVAKLFNLIQPDRAYFGQKDGQQTAIVRKMVKDLDFRVDVVVVPTVRNSDGLALSSRNVYLTQEQRRAAPVIYRALCASSRLWGDGGRNGDRLRAEVLATLRQEPVLDGIDYVSVADAETLEELEQVQGRAMVSVAVRLGNTRLIDNVILD